ncbi:MAG: ABC transporter ATP-binding protein [Pyrobaculum sp.]
MLKLQNIEKFLGSFRLGPINLEIPKGQRLAVVGPSGSGKSTLLRIVAGLLKPDRGRIYIDNRDSTELEPWKRGVGVVFQTPALFPSLTVLENVAEPLLSHGWSRRDATRRALEVLERVGLRELARRYPPELSRGQQQRVSLARALALEPSVLLLDEPTTALDPHLRSEILPYIYEASRGRSMIYVTHDFEEAAYIADRVLVLINGKTAAEGGVVELFENPPSPEVAEFLGYVNKIRTRCGFLYFRPWDVAPGGPFAAKVLAVVYKLGRYEIIGVHEGGQSIRLMMQQRPVGDVVYFDVVHGKCFNTNTA